MQTLLQYRNTKLKDIGQSPAELVFGHPTRDLLPTNPGTFTSTARWHMFRTERELALSKRYTDGAARWSEHTRTLPPSPLEHL